MTLDYVYFINAFSQLIWPVARFSGLMLSVPVFSSALMPARAKVIFILAMALVVAPMIPDSLSFIDFKGIYLLYMLQEFLLGILIGFIFDLVFQVFILGGQIIAMQAGLGFATMVDPASKANVPIVGQLYLIMVTLLFLSLNGHLVLIESLIGSYKLMPVGTVNLSTESLWQAVTFSGWMFKEAVLVALPAILSLLLVSMSFGIMSRVAPQLNLFSIGFPMTLLMGFVIIYFSLPGVASQVEDSFAQGMQMIKGLIN